MTPSTFLSPLRSPRGTAFCLLAFLVVSCGTAASAPEGSDGRGPGRGIGARPASAASDRINFRMTLQRPWTDRFQEERMLIADFVEIHGPADLLQHIAVLTDPDLYENKTWTTPTGLRQEITRTSNKGSALALAQLDNWKIYAVRRLVVVQAPEDRSVRIEARGQAVLLRGGEGDTEQRGERLLIVGEHGAGG